MSRFFNGLYTMLAAVFLSLIISTLETIFKVNQKYFEKSLQLLKQVVSLYC